MRIRLVFAFSFLLCFILIQPAYSGASSAAVVSPFLYTFNAPGTLFVTTKMEQSSSPYFWISSGARLVINNGIGSTIQGPLQANDPQRIQYATINALDT